MMTQTLDWTVDDIRSLFQGAPPERNPVLRALDVAFSLWGYDYHNPIAKIRENDAIVRRYAVDALNGAASALEAKRAVFKDDHVPPVSREHPFPPPEIAKTLQRTGDRIRLWRNAAAQVGGMESPAQDHVSRRLRSERELLVRLMDVDLHIVVAARALRDAVNAVSIEQMTEPGWSTEIDRQTDVFSGAMRARREMLIP